MPQRIQRKRARGWQMPEGAIYVGRPSRYGNPYRVVNLNLVIDQWGHEFNCARGEARGVAVRHFREDLASGRIDIDLDELRSHDLVCWCPLDQPCHGDVLIEIANA